MTQAPSSTPAATTPAPARSVPTRRMDFEPTFVGVPRHFAEEDDLIGSHLTAALSSVFPDGEDFFVRSVRHYRDQVTDPKLKRDVAGFIGQEAVHGREHRAFNEHLATVGFPTKRMERMTKFYLETRERLLSPKSNLAVTAALEHFTATLGELVLTSEELRDEFGHPAVRDLFVWHALEETEHKAVAFDVYQAIGGGERMRIGTMKVMRAFFVFAITTNVISSLLADRSTYNPRTLLASIRRFRKSPLIDREVWRRLKAYDRKGFHPDDFDTSALVEEWRTRLFGEQGTLNDRLAGSAA